MVQKKSSRQIRRFSTMQGRCKEERDGGLYLLVTQMALCGLLVLLAYAAMKLEPPFLPQLRIEYQRLISARKLDVVSDMMESDVAAQYEALRDDAADAIAAWLTDLLAPIPKSPAVPVAAQSEVLEGAGGWMGVDEPYRTAPTSCDLSPVVLSAYLETPVAGRVTSSFGYRAHPITQAADFHRGVDIAAVQGSGIYTPLPGTVLEIDSSAIYGNYITLEHGRGLYTTYSHCDSVVVQPGTNLRKGELVATVGSTGISTGPHLHFEISKDGKYYNPAWVLEGMNQNGV